MRLFMDISALYIRKLHDYRKLVSRKVKAKPDRRLAEELNSPQAGRRGIDNVLQPFRQGFYGIVSGFRSGIQYASLPEHHIVLPSPNELTPKYESMP